MRKSNYLTPTGQDHEHWIATSMNAKVILQALSENTTILVKAEPGGQWFVPKKLLHLQSRMLARSTQLEWEMPKAFGRPAVELFLQWLLTGDYQEYDMLVPLLSYTNYQDYNKTLVPYVESSEGQSMSYFVKAGMLAWKLGEYLEAPRFQNHAMIRLFHALSCTDNDWWINADMCKMAMHNSAGNSARNTLGELFEDILMRNWGDKTIIERDDSEKWRQMLSEGELFKRFVGATMMPLEDRQLVPLKLIDYMVKEN
ncbi:hypothetical protein BDV95DRAFT_595634 [Massariosphaeria phaeospora]|uniref:BTB domain-containing protein n=1 Tax=Massariosphaeria phaeospora TaxID=100035 RepID=A0A7C8MLT3_9PLEO|nr:hypothetical protein BDV95DRAFT_595634 [Massariosphaeria phaeospora]